jgi:hypothetical protein
MPKKAIGISKCSYSTELCHAVGLNTLEYAIRKRNISFVLQLLDNQFTKRILEIDVDARKQVLTSFSHDIISSPQLEETTIRRSCNEMLAAMKDEAKTHDSCRFTKFIKNRLEQKEDNLLEFILHKAHSIRDFI